MLSFSTTKREVDKMKGNVNKHRAVFVKIFLYRSHLIKMIKSIKRVVKKNRKLLKNC